MAGLAPVGDRREQLHRRDATARAELGRDILAGGEVASDARRLLLYFRRDAAGRLLMGGRGPFAEPRATSDWRHLERATTLLYPQLKGVRFEYRWAGRVAITADFMPHVHGPRRA